jgi:hypothetical protein
MVRLDQKLLFDARSLCNGEDGHRLQELISACDQAVDLHLTNCFQTEN